jgi:replicative DNA helicase
VEAEAMSENKDPLEFNFGLDFKSSAERVKGEREHRLEQKKRALPYNNQFLDDRLRCILPHDLILIGARTGAGKTELARSIGASNAKKGRQVFYFALEAEPNEIERRTKYGILVSLVAKGAHHHLGDMNYPDWYRGEIEHICSSFNSEAERKLGEDYRTLHTYYRGVKFDHEDIRKLFLAIQSQADLIILDHLHYVDIEDENENRGFKRTVKMIRDTALGIGRPVILVAHIRKATGDNRRGLVPEMDDFHGSSDIGKIATRAIMLAPCRTIQSTDRHIANTFISIPKDRVDGEDGLIALCRFDRRQKIYEANYTLGRVSKGEFEPLGDNEVPRWAKHHQGQSTPLVPTGGSW